MTRLVPLLMTVGAALAAPLRAQTAPAADPVPPHETFTLDSRALGERRVINVWTPPGYADSTSRRWPVLYMPDGGVAEDFPHLVNTVDSLRALGRIPPVIVVGIENTERRRDMTGPTRVASDSTIAQRVGGSAAFRAFIRDELLPAVGGRYRVTGPTAIVGESLAGLFIVETFLLEPRLFDGYIALDPSVWWNDGELVRTAAARVRAGTGRQSVFLASSDVEEIATGTAALAATVVTEAASRVALRYDARPDLKHATIYRGVKADALVAVLGAR